MYVDATTTVVGMGQENRSVSRKLNKLKHKQKRRNIQEERKYMKIDIYITSDVEKHKLKQL